MACAREGHSVEDTYWEVVLADIVTAADLLRPVYDSTGGADGFVSVEVSPDLAHDTAGTKALASSLFERVARPNVMIKIPATLEGIAAIEDSIAAGINVNVTLIFALDRHARDRRLPTGPRAIRRRRRRSRSRCRRSPRSS